MNSMSWSRTSTSAEARFERTAQELALIQGAIAQRVDTRGDAFRMTVGDRHAIERPEAARLIGEWIATHPRWHPLRAAATRARRARRLRDRRHVAPQPDRDAQRRTDVAWRADATGGPRPRPGAPRPDLARAPARATHQDLPALAERVDAAGVAAAEEAARAQHGLAQPFKHADALKAATARSSEIAIEMQNRQAPMAAPEASTQSGPPDPAAAAAAEVDRLTRASFPTPARGARNVPTTSTARRPPPHRPGRDGDLSR